MVNLWIIAAGALAAAAAALIARTVRKAGDLSQPSGTSIGPVSEEWLSNARGQGDEYL